MSMAENPETNLEKAIQKINQAAQKGAQIICLPELFNTLYFPQVPKNKKFFQYAEKIPGKTTKSLGKIAKENKIVLIAGSIFEKAGNKYYNTTVVFNEKGKLLGKYRKTHIPHDPNFFEQHYFEPGNTGYRVFKTKYGNIGTLICYDQWFPEAARINALMGADIVFYPTAIGTNKHLHQTEGNWQQAWENVQRGHAIANGIIVCAVNRVGIENNSKFWGGSFVCNGFGKTIKRAGKKEEVLIAQVDLGHGKYVKEGWRFFYNRKPETYKKLIETKK
ncbi:MAG: carbon-nitrogen hydrolase [Candidatus Diapherotrites archaeon]|nr:carbon-nitrogen hydrolase [Candidatus Diapherotrites archaeon]